MPYSRASDMGLQLAIVLPTYNERGNLRSLIERLDRELAEIDWEAIVVDDSSPDGTAEEARVIGREDRRVRVIERIGRRGLASAAIEGMLATAAPIVAVMDADHQHDPALLPRMLAAVSNGEADLAYASRFCEGASTEAWGRPDRVKASGLANALARRLTGVELSDPMSGYFMLRTETLRGNAHRLSGVGFKILLDILATVEKPLKVKEFPLVFAARAEGESKLDRTVVFEFLVGLYDRWFGRIIPTRYALFGTIGALGVVVHMIVLALFLQLFGGTFKGQLLTAFELGQTVAAVVAMTFNFVLNNALTYADSRLGEIRPGLLCRPARERWGCRRAGAVRSARIPGGARRGRGRIGMELRAEFALRLGTVLESAQGEGDSGRNQRCAHRPAELSAMRHDLFGQDQCGQRRNPQQVHDSAEKQQQHQRPAATDAVEPMAQTQLQRPDGIAAEAAVLLDKLQRRPALDETQVLERGPLVEAGDDQQRGAEQGGRDRHLRGQIAKGGEARMRRRCGRGK
jgi:dolichol-phosphate mannosyltransferase